MDDTDLDVFVTIRKEDLSCTLICKICNGRCYWSIFTCFLYFSHSAAAACKYEADFYKSPQIITGCFCTFCYPCLYERMRNGLSTCPSCKIGFDLFASGQVCCEFVCGLKYIIFIVCSHVRHCRTTTCKPLLITFDHILHLIALMTTRTLKCVLLQLPILLRMAQKKTGTEQQGKIEKTLQLLTFLLLWNKSSANGSPHLRPGRLGAPRERSRMFLRCFLEEFLVKRGSVNSWKPCT